MGRLDGKITIVTGATSGIGRRTAEIFVKEGARVVATGRREEHGRSLEAALGKDRSVALREGYARATWTIIDANLTTLIAAVLLFGFGSSLGFTLALVLFAGIRERLDGADVPLPFKGTAIAMITAGFMSLAFMGFAGLDRFH